MQRDPQNFNDDLVIDEQLGFKKKFSLKKLLSFSLFHWNLLVLFIVSFVSLSIFLASRSAIFTIPQEARHSRKQFFLAEDRYKKNPNYWDAKLKSWMATSKGMIQEGKYEELVRQTGLLSDEVFISFLLKELHLEQNFFDHCVIFTKENAAVPTFILSKYESKAWPL
jgi:hypothetical protein